MDCIDKRTTRAGQDRDACDRRITKRRVDGPVSQEPDYDESPRKLKRLSHCKRSGFRSRWCCIDVVNRRVCGFDGRAP